MKIIFVRHGQSTANVAGINGTSYDPTNIILTDKGEKQAKITGKYLNKIFGKFDVIYTSPINRCVQTSNIIQKYINKCKIVSSDLLIEIGEKHYKLDGMSKLEQDNFMGKNKKIKSYENKIKNEQNPFNKLQLQIKYNGEIEKYVKPIPTVDQAYKNYRKFLNMLKKSNYEQILVVAHGGSIAAIYKIISSINIHGDIDLLKIDNCSIMCISYENNKFELISKPDATHLNDIS